MKYPKIAQRLKESIGEKGWKAQDLANRAGVPKSSISQYMSGMYAPNNQRAEKIAEVLGVSAAWLMGFDVPKERKRTKEEAEKDFFFVKRFNALTEPHQQVVLKLMDSLMEIQ